jgi:flagellar biosynthesis chaperone FliJ
MKITDHINFALDARVSSDKQDDISNQAQHENTETGLLKANPRALIHYRFADVHTGRNPRRPHLDRVYKQLKRHNNANPNNPITCLLYLRWDRFARNSMPAASQVERFKEIGVEINAFERWVDWDDAMSKALFMFEAIHAEQVSNDTSDHVIRCYTHKYQSGIYCVARVPHIFNRIYQDRALKQYTIVKSETWQPFRNAVDMILVGVNRKEAWRQNGGREVLGSEDAFYELLVNPIMIGKYRGVDVRVPITMTPEEYRYICNLTLMKAPRGKGKRKAMFFLSDVLLCPHCNSGLSSSSPRGRSKTYHYYVCAKHTPRHYRQAMEAVNNDALEMIKQLTLSAGRVQRLGKLAAQRSEENRSHAEKRLKAIDRELATLNESRLEVLRMRVRKEITAEEKELLNQETEQQINALEVERAKVQNVIAHHGQVLENVLASLQHVGLVLSELPNRAQLTHFLKMAFPSGLFYNGKSGNFRTEGMNAALSLLPELSGSCTKIETRLPANKASNRVMSGLPGQNRTATTDLALFWRYVDRFRLAV